MTICGNLLHVIIYRLPFELFFDTLPFRISEYFSIFVHTKKDKR